MLSRGGFELNEIWHRQARGLAEGDRREREDERSLSGPEAYRRKGINLRRRGDPEGADRHELHALGLETASAHDHETRMTEARNKAHKTANAAYDAGRGGGEEHKRRKAAFKNVRDARKHHSRLSSQWHDMAERVHNAGGNAALAHYKPRLVSDKDHQNEMVRHIANRNSVSVNHDEYGHDLHTLHGDAMDRLTRVERAGREAHEALTAHHPNSNPRLSHVRRDSFGFTTQQVGTEQD